MAADGGGDPAEHVRREVLFIALCFAAASAIPFMPEDTQTRFSAFGLGAPPLLMLALTTVGGTAALYLLRKGEFFTRGGVGLREIIGIATALAIPVIVVDLVAPYPADMNAPWPDAWLYYPAIAIPAIAALHLIPLSLAFALTRRATPAILVAALAEPALQFALTDGLPNWQRLFTAVHIFIFGLVGLFVLRTSGLPALILLRLVYYMHWHILWGQARLALPA